MLKIGILEPMHDSGIQILKDNGIDIIGPKDFTNGEIIELADQVVGYIVRSKKIPLEAYTENIKIISKHGAGVDNIDIPFATEKEIKVTNTPKANNNAVAEYTLALMINSARNIIESQKSLIKNGFDFRKDFLGYELKEKTLGIFGLGSIGAKVAEKCSKGMGMNILVYDPYVDKKYAKKINVNLVDNKKEVLSNSDFISINMPLNKKTKDFITLKDFKLMKENCILINTSRGGIVNEQDLIIALKEELISKAALDVFDQEPPQKDNPLLEMENVIKTPHIGAQTLNAMKNMSIGAANNIIEVLNGNKPDTLLN